MARIPNAVLEEIHTTNSFKVPDGSVVNSEPPLRESFCYALYSTILRQKPKTVVEVGMAYGTSTLSILTALKETGGTGRLISLDPVQSTDFRGIGIYAVKRSGLDHLHQLIEEPDYLALPALLRASTPVDFVYIDGWHTFDYALLDWFYADRLIQPGGIVAFNDCNYKAVHKVIKFLLSHRHYEEMDVGLKPVYESRLIGGSIVKRISGRNGADRYFKKLDKWEPGYNFFHYF